MASNKKSFGVTVSKVDEEMLNLQLEAYKLETSGTLEERIGRLVSYTRETFKKKSDLAKCDTCGGVSHVDLEKCPFCGVGDDDETEDEEDDGPVAPPPEPQDVEDEEDGDVEEEEPAKPAKEAAKPAKPAKGAKPAKEAAKPAKEAAKPAKGAKPAKTKALAKVPEPLPPELANLTSKDLDAAVGRVTELRKKGAINLWELGGELKEIHDKQLWKLRRDNEGNPLYKGFGQFCAQEIQSSHTTVFQLIDVAANFTREQVAQLGHKKLALVLQAPKEVQAELVQKAENGATHRDLAVEVKAKREEAGISKRDTGRKEMPKGKPGAKAGKGKSSKDTLTIAAVLGKTTVALYKTPPKGSKELVPATSFEDAPFGYVDLANGVREFFNFAKNAKGELVMKVMRKRAE